MGTGRNRLKPQPIAGDLIQAGPDRPWFLVTKAVVVQNPHLHTKRMVELDGVNLQTKRMYERVPFTHARSPETTIIRDGKTILDNGKLPGEPGFREDRDD